MKKRLFAIPMAFGLAMAIAGCGNEVSSTSKTSVATTTVTTTETVATTTDEKTTTTTETTIPDEGSYTVKVYDIDDELIGEKTIKLNPSSTVLSQLEENFNVESYEGSWGTVLTSINNSVVDNNYYLAIYENGSLASTGVDGLEANPGDVFEYKVECWKTIAFGYTFDEYDILVDKAIYHYAKNGLKTSLANSNSFLDSTYWQAMAINLMKNNGYDTNLFNVNLFTDAYKNSLYGVDYDNMPNLTAWPTDANYAKWYYAARLFNVEDENFTSHFSAQIGGITSYRDEYSLPFNLSIAKEMNLDSLVSSDVLHTTYRASLEYGTDGIAWQLTGMALYNTLADSEFDVFTLENIQKNYAKDVSTAIILLPFAATNKNPREFNITENEDLLEYLFSFYNQDSYKFNIELDSSTDSSSNQIYASLMAYKVQRDLGKAVVLFA